MIYSMTGYGKTECLIQNQKYIIELRSLNSKQMDLALRVSPLFREKELDIRTLLTQQLERGKVDCAIYADTAGTVEQGGYTPINTDALDYYVSVLQGYASEKGLGDVDVLSLALRMPDVTKVQEQKQVTAEDWAALRGGILQAVEQFNAFRAQEGESLRVMFTEKLNGILELLEQVEPLENERIQKIRGRLETNLASLSAETQQAIDKNRLEQEMIYYLEKLDINEEKVRLRNHVRYFMETMACAQAASNSQPTQTSAGVGKKLGFVAQEMGREINTLGSKSNHSEMQIIVVKMKDILEQIKEQVLNVL